jgi:hypothetical protein
MDKVNWAKIAATLSKRYTIIQPVLRERPFRGTVSYRKLTLRQYISLFTVVDNFVGGTSAGSHIAAAFDVPAMIVIWKSLEQGLAFPISGQGFKASFLYPQHWFIAAEDVSHLHFDQVRLERTLDNLMRHGKQGRPTSIGNHPRWPCGFTPRPPARIANVNGRRLGRIPTAYGDSVAEGEQVWPVGVPIEPSPSPELKAPAMRGPKKAAIIQQADANAVLPSAKPSSTHDEPPSS